MIMFEEPHIAEALRTYMLETAPVVALTLDADHCITGANAQARQFLGKACLGCPFSAQIVDFSRTLDLPALIRRTRAVHALTLSSASGMPETLSFRFFPLTDGTLALGSLDFPAQQRLRDEVLGLNRELNNLTRQLHQVNAELRESEEQFRMLSEHSPIGISLVRPDMTYEYVNPFFTQMFGYSVADVFDRHTWYEKAYPDPVYRERVRKAWMADFAERDGFGRMQQEPFTVRCKDGTDKIIRVNGAVLPDTRVLMTHEDVTQLVNAQNALEHLAMHDPLTGLFNRRSILERLAQEISRAKREDGRLSVGMLDIDHFKNVNDTHGHQVGDEVLIAFSKRIQAPLRDYDSLGRYGGEEFLVITAAPHARIEGNLFERLRTNVADAPISTKAGAISVTVSIGVARGTGASTVDGLIAAADAALYQAKADGRNRVVETGMDRTER